MQKKIPFVSIIVLSWNNIESTTSCLESLKKLSYKNKEIIFVDNGSTDGSKEFLSKQKNIRYVDLPKNLGFTGGHIEGLKHAEGQFIAIINNDLLIDDSWIEKCLETFSRQKDAAAVGGRSYAWDGKEKNPKKVGAFSSFQEVDSLGGYTKTLLNGEYERPVDGISGAALMIKKDIIDKVGYLDDTFFAYYEETDLIARFIRAGYRAYYNPEAIVWHEVAGSSKGGEESYFYLYMMHRNRYMFGLKNFDNEYLPRFKKNYTKEFISSLSRYIRHRSDIDARARVNAYVWNMKHKEETLRKREKSISLGKTYNKKLPSYLPKDITIIIPCYNYAKYVSQAIDSALNQTVSPTKIIIINDGSTDNSLDEIVKYKSHPLIEVIDQKNQGVIKTKNKGIGLSRTYWTLFLDADDTLDIKALEKMLQKAEEKPTDVIYSDMQLFGAGRGYFSARNFSPYGLVSQNFINNSSLINTTSLVRSGGYKEEMSGGLEDWELYLTLFEQGARFQYVAEPLLNYRQHEKTIASRNTLVLEKDKELYSILKNLHPTTFKKYSRVKMFVISPIRGLFYIFRYPGLILVTIRSIPAMIKQAVHALLHNARSYIAKKKGL